MSKAHSHYYKYVGHLQYVDVYRVLQLFDVKDEPVAHAVKKLLCAGNRGVKDKETDIKQAIDSLKRQLEMMQEDLLKDGKQSAS
jgi:predicted Ser/Thr protein kinase